MFADPVAPSRLEFGGKYSAKEFAVLKYRDSTTGKRLVDPVAIVPCGCRVNMETVKSINVIKKIIFETLGHSACPACKKLMSGFFKDPHTKKATYNFFYRLGKQISGTPDFSKEEPIEKWVGPIPPYPQGQLGNFKVIDDIKKSCEHCPRSTLNRSVQSSRCAQGTRWLILSSSTKSVITMVHFSTSYYNRFISIKFRKSKGFEDYLRAHDMHLLDFNYLGESDKGLNSYQEYDPDKMRKLFNIITTNNTFPEEHAKYINAILDKATEPLFRIEEIG